MPATPGPEFSEPFATYDHDSSCWRTSQVTFHWGSDEYSETWPKSGTTHGGRAYEQPMSEPATDANGSSSLLPTPEASDGTGSRRSKELGGTRPSGSKRAITLGTVTALLPTPSAGQHNYDEDPDQWLARRETLKAKGINGNGAGTPLGVAVRLLPTPTVQDSAGGRNSTAGRTSWEGVHVGDTLSDVAYKWAGRPTSAPTSPPSTDGPPSWDDQPLPLWTDDD